MQRIHHIIHKFYDLTAPYYEPAITPIMLPLARDLVATTPLPDASTVLDLGTGTGALARCAANGHRRVIGIDNNLSMLRIAESLRRTHRWPGVRFVHADAYEIAIFPAHSCDAVLASFSLSEGVPEKILRAVRRVLRPGGVLAIQEWGPHDRNNDPRWLVDRVLHSQQPEIEPPMLDEIEEALETVFPWQMQMQDADDYRNALTESGFEVISSQEFKPVTLHLPIQMFIDYCLAWLPRRIYFDALSMRQRMAALRRMEAALRDRESRRDELIWAPTLFRAVAIRR
ncbi:MAG: hypothetical protein Kow0077_06380 [Anaerolineae bacterium]